MQKFRHIFLTDLSIMGITVNESYTTSAGFDVPSYYISLGEARIEILRPMGMPTPGVDFPPRPYAINAHFNIWVSKEMRDQGRAMIGGKGVTIERDTPITENVYDVLYDKLKEGLTNYTEDI